MNNTIITALLSGGFFSFMTYILNLNQSRKIGNAQIEGQELANIEKAVQIWQNLNKDLEMKVERQEQRIKTLEKDKIQLEKDKCERPDCPTRLN